MTLWAIEHFVKLDRRRPLRVRHQNFWFGDSYKGATIMRSAHDGIAIVGFPIGIKRNAFDSRPIFRDSAHSRSL